MRDDPIPTLRHAKRRHVDLLLVEEPRCDPDRQWLEDNLRVMARGAMQPWSAVRTGHGTEAAAFHARGARAHGMRQRAGPIEARTGAGAGRRHRCLRHRRWAVAAELIAPGGAIDLSSGIGHCDSAAYIAAPDDLEEDTR